MPRPMTINTAPEHIRNELNERLRANAYSGMIELSEWLQSQGVQASKSAVHRYSSDLKAKDRASDILVKAVKGSESESNETLDLMMELATLRMREHKILTRLEELGRI